MPRRTIMACALGVAVLTAALVTLPCADADVRYTQSVTVAAAQPPTARPATPPSASPTVHLATYAKGQRQRQETLIRTGSSKTTTVVLTLCDTGQIVRMDPALKIYTTAAISDSPVTPFGLPSPPHQSIGTTGDFGTTGDASSPFGSGIAPNAGSPFPAPKSGTSATPFPPAARAGDTVSASPMIDGDAPQAPASQATPDASAMTGSVVLTYAVQDLGTETVHGMTTHHDAVTVRRQASGCAGTGDTTTKMEIWFAPVKAGLDCPEQSALQRTITTARGCKVTYTVQGDVDALTQVAGDLPVRVKFFDKDGQDKGAMEMQDYDQASLDDSLFSVPSDYKQVSASEFARAESQAAFPGITGGPSPFMPAQPGQSGAFPGQPATNGPGAGGAFPQPTGGDAGTVNQSGTYPSPTQPTPAGTP